MKRTVYFPEIFEMVGNVETKEEKIAILHKFWQEKGFFDILRLCYDPRIEWIVTREEIEHLTYNHMDIADYDLAPTTLFLEARQRLYNFTNNRKQGKAPLEKNKVIKLIANMFSVLHHKEIELFKQMVSGEILETGITEDLVREAFPNLLSPPIKRGPGRPAGAKNKTEEEKIAEQVAKEEAKKPAPKKRGRPAGSKNIPRDEEGNPLPKKRGRPAGTKNKKKPTVKKVVDKPVTEE